MPDKLKPSVGKRNNMSKDWENDEKIDVRTRFAIKILFFIFKVLSPYKFAHEFKDDLKMLQDEVEKLR